MAPTGHDPTSVSRTIPSSSFDRAVDRFTSSLSVEQKREFELCSLEDVYDSINAIQNIRGSQNAMRNMARIQAFLEAMDDYRKVVEAFLNCTPFMGYVWGPIRFILLATNTWVTSLDVILNAYKQIQERLPSFMQYQVLFDKNLEMRRALELYFCDILEFHYNALKFLSRPGWKKLFASFWKTFETRFRCILDSLSRHKDLIESEKSTIALFEAQRTRELAENHFRDMEETEKKKQLSLVLEKLEAADYQIDQYAISEQRRKTSSGKWILQHDLFREWADPHASKNPLLYINGIPGAGKTTLASQIIETLLQSATFPALFFYCKHDVPTKNTLGGILRALLAQLSCKDNTVATYLHGICCKQDQPGVTAILEELAEVALGSQVTAFIVLDGLDECEPGEVQKILSWFVARQNDISSIDHGRIRLLCVGQRTEFMQHILSKASQISLENPQHQNDVRKYIAQQACYIRDEFDIGSDVEANIVRRVSNAAKSMFLFAKVVMENLLNQTSQHDLLQELVPEVFPVDLKAAYERVVATVYQEGPQRKAAVRIIEWVACAKRPLKWGEVQATFFVDPQTSSSDFQGRRLRKTCKRLCGSLIDVDSDNDRPEAETILNLVHDTARDYLQKNGLLNLPAQNARMALYCVDYLISQPCSLRATNKDLKEFTRKGYYAFLVYAASYWLDHLVAGSEQTLDSSALAELYVRLATRAKCFLQETHILDQHKLDTLDREPSRLFEIIRDISQGVAARNQWKHLETRVLRILETVETTAEDLRNDSTSTLEHSMMAMYGTTRYRCPKLGCVHFREGFTSKSERNIHLDRHRRPFVCTERHCPFELLGFSNETGLKRHLSRNHSLEEQSNQIPFPQLTKTHNDDIFSAASTGDIDAMRRLLSLGKSVDAKGQDASLRELLDIAALSGHLSICKLLVEKGAHIDYGVLESAMVRNDPELIHYFLSWNTVSPNLTLKGTSILHIAASSSEVAVKLLLQRRYIEPDPRDLLGETPLHLAVKSRNEEIVGLLLATGKVDPNSLSYREGRPLATAAHLGSTLIASALLATGKVDPDAKASNGDTPLMKAARQGKEDIVQMLLATNRVDPDSRNRSGETPLMVASGNRKDVVVNMLLCTRKVGVNAADEKGRTPLWHATTKNNGKVIRLLLKHPDIEPDQKLPDGKTALMAAVAQERTEIVSMLLATGRVDVNVSGKNKQTPLMVAATKGNEAIVKMLLDTGKVNVKGSHGQTALGNANISKAEGVVDLLLAAGAHNPSPEQRSPAKDSLQALQNYNAQLSLLRMQNEKRLQMVPRGQEKTVPPEQRSPAKDPLQALQAYNMQLSLLKTQNEKRLRVARMKQEEATPSPQTEKSRSTDEYQTRLTELEQTIKRTQQTNQQAQAARDSEEQLTQSQQQSKGSLKRAREEEPEIVDNGSGRARSTAEQSIS